MNNNAEEYFKRNVSSLVGLEVENVTCEFADSSSILPGGFLVFVFIKFGFSVSYTISATFSF